MSSPCVSYRDSLVFPVSDPKWLRRCLIWGILFVLILTWPILIGYHLATVKSTAQGSEDLPDFRHPFRLALLGGSWCVGYACLSLLPLFFLAGLVTPLADQVAGPELSDLVFTMGFLLIGINAVLLLPASLLRVAMTGKADDGANPIKLYRDIRVGGLDYWKVLFAPVIVGVPIAALSQFGVTIPLLLILVPVGLFAHAHLLGSYYRTHFE